MLRRFGRVLQRALGHPATGAVAVLSLSLGIAVVTAVFASADAIVLRPFPVRDADRLVLVSWDGRGAGREALSIPDLDALAASPVFAGVGGWSVHATMLGGEDVETMTLTSVVTDGFFSTLGVAASEGRLLPPGEPAAVLGHGFWVRRFGGDPSIVGRRIRLNRHEVTVVGVLPSDFQGLQRYLSPDVWVAVDTWTQIVPGARAGIEDPDEPWLQVVARLGPTGADSQAAAQLQALASGLRSGRAGESKATLALVPLKESRSRALLLLVGGLLLVAALIAMVACANVASLLIARGEARRRELAIRAAIGATRAQLAQQLLRESAVVGVVAAAVSVVISRTMIGALPRLLPDVGLPLGFDFRYDLRAVLATVAATVIAVIVFGLPAALRASRGTLAVELTGDGRAPSARFRPGDLLVVGQMAVCLFLLLVAGLVVQSLRGASAADPGFVRQPALLVQTASAIVGTPAAEAAIQRARVGERVAALPGVRGVAWTRRLPLSPNGGGAMREVSVPGVTQDDGQPATRVRYTSVSAGYFRVMGTTLLDGREFETGDATGRGVAVVNETMARRFWPGVRAVGQLFRLDGIDGPEVEVVGVARDGKYLSLDEDPMPYLFLPLGQFPSGEATLVATLAPSASVPASVVREVFRDAAPGLPIATIGSLDGHMAFALYGYRLGAGMLGTLGGLTLLLAIVGLHAVVAQHVGRSRRSIGIRLAIGARRGDVLRLILGRTAALIGVGAAVGLAAALATARLIASQLFGTSPADPLTIVTALTLLLAAAATASLGPILQALRLDPVDTLRAD